MEQVKTINHLGQVVYQESVEFYKEKLSVYSKDFLQNSLIPQLYEWSNAYKAAVELTKQKALVGLGGGKLMTDDERKHQLDLAEKLSGIELVEYFPILPDGSLDLDNPCYAPKQL